jgi:uncharacterized protein (DUF2237 family)
MRFVVLVLTLGYLSGVAAAEASKNVLGGELKPNGTSASSGFYRDGYCHTGAEDRDRHVVSAIVTDEFLKYTKSKGNDLQTPVPQYGFPGLKAGDRWCLCADRWAEARDAGVAPPVVLDATHENALATIPLETLKKYSR